MTFHLFTWQTLQILIIFNAFNFETSFLKNQKKKLKKLEYRFLVENAALEAQHLHKKLPFQKLMLKQIEWGVLNGSVNVLNP